MRIGATLLGILLTLAPARAVSASPCGGRAGSWVAMNARGGPSVSAETPVVLMGKRLLVFGFGAQGAILDLCANRWVRMSKAGLPEGGWQGARFSPLVVGNHVVLLAFGNNGEVPFATGGVTALVYDVAANRWSTVPDQPGAFAWRRGALVSVAGREVVVWGGAVEPNPGRGGQARLLDDGARLDPLTGTWRPMSRKGAPSGRSYPRGVWTGTRLFVWGGVVQRNPYQCGAGDCQPIGGGGVYDPATDTWTAVSDVGAPSARSGPATKRVGDSVLVWGGVKHPDGALYDPAANVWRAIPPPPGSIAAATLDDFDVGVDAGKVVIVTNRRQAAVYDVAASSWTAVPDVELPLGLKDLRALGGVGLQLIVQHKQTGALGVGTLARVNTRTARWEIAPLPPQSAPTSLETGIIAWADGQLVLWGPRYQEVHYESVPSERKGCGPHRPGDPICDPVTPVREVRIGRGGVEGGLLRPVFVPAKLRGTVY